MHDKYDTERKCPSDNKGCAYSLPIERKLILSYYLKKKITIKKFNMNLSKALFLVALITLSVLLVLGMIIYLRLKS